MIPRMGPAQGAQSNPVATPSISEDQIDSSFLFSESLEPSATKGRVARSDSAGKTSPSPNSASNASAAHRPASFALTAQLPPTAASVATTANVSAIPTNNGKAPRAKPRSARANTNGSTGRMQGLTIVSMPPKKARSAISI